MTDNTFWAHLFVIETLNEPRKPSRVLLAEQESQSAGKDLRQLSDGADAQLLLDLIAKFAAK